MKMRLMSPCWTKLEIVARKDPSWGITGLQWNYLRGGDFRPLSAWVCNGSMCSTHLAQHFKKSLR